MLTVYTILLLHNIDVYIVLGIKSHLILICLFSAQYTENNLNCSAFHLLRFLIVYVLYAIFAHFFSVPISTRVLNTFDT